MLSIVSGKINRAVKTVIYGTEGIVLAVITGINVTVIAFQIGAAL